MTKKQKKRKEKALRHGTRRVSRPIDGKTFTKIIVDETFVENKEDSGE